MIFKMWTSNISVQFLDRLDQPEFLQENDVIVYEVITIENKIAQLQSQKLLSQTTKTSTRNLHPDIVQKDNTNSSSTDLRNVFPSEETSPFKTEPKTEPTKNRQPVQFKDEHKFWFFKNGQIRPKKDAHKKIKLWPEQASHSDRIIDQLLHIPLNYDENNVKTILLPHSISSWDVPMGDYMFKECPVSACVLTSNRSEIQTADALLFREFLANFGYVRNPGSRQIWILYRLESPIHSTTIAKHYQVNWTASYRLDSDIVTPYEKWVYYNDSIRQMSLNEMKNYAKSKTHQVAWFVSNCHTVNDRRKYAVELAKYINVDIYGRCGNLKCPKSDVCFQMLNTKYKFYLAFENSNCRDYMTEKFFVNGLSHDILPIVMGARKEDYVQNAPENSFIHVDDFNSPKELADYLILVDKNDTLYQSYFQWKNTGEFINTYFWCRLCTMVHEVSHEKHYENINEWWKKEVCTKKSWKEQVFFLR